MLRNKRLRYKYLYCLVFIWFNPYTSRYMTHREYRLYIETRPWWLYVMPAIIHSLFHLYKDNRSLRRQVLCPSVTNIELPQVNTINRLFCIIGFQCLNVLKLKKIRSNEIIFLSTMTVYFKKSLKTFFLFRFKSDWRLLRRVDDAVCLKAWGLVRCWNMTNCLQSGFSHSDFSGSEISLPWNTAGLVQHDRNSLADVTGFRMSFVTGRNCHMPLRMPTHSQPIHELHISPMSNSDHSIWAVLESNWPVDGGLKSHILNNMYLIKCGDETHFLKWKILITFIINLFIKVYKVYYSKVTYIEIHHF